MRRLAATSIRSEHATHEPARAIWPRLNNVSRTGRSGFIVVRDLLVVLECLHVVPDFFEQDFIGLARIRDLYVDLLAPAAVRESRA